MTREEAGRFWPIIKAYAEGKQIEVKDHKGIWSDIECSDFDLDVDYYRIKKKLYIGHSRMQTNAGKR